MIHTCTEHSKPITWEAYPFENNCPVCEQVETLTFDREDLVEEAGKEYAKNASNYENLCEDIQALEKKLKGAKLKDHTHKQIAKLVIGVWVSHLDRQTNKKTLNKG
ncbi:MAG: hypothetical protein V3V74_07320 [Nitrosomonadaceae bacterium]